jgi:hypothetical protein
LLLTSVMGFPNQFFKRTFRIGSFVPISDIVGNPATGGVGAPGDDDDLVREAAPSPFTSGDRP